MRIPSRLGRLLAIGLAAGAVCPSSGLTQETTLSQRIEICASCHGADGNSRAENIPSLAGQPEAFIMDQLIFMREGVRPVEAMTPFVEDLGDDEIIAVAKHFAELPPQASDEPIDPALVERGAALAERLRCASCHLPSLAGQEQIPRLAKQRVDYLNQAMKAYRDNTRKGADTIMSATLFGVSDEDIRALAHYAASR
jgi:cytochrome c553